MTKRIQIEFTEHQKQFLEDEYKLTGNTQSSIVRQALNSYMFKLAIERGNNKV